MNEYEKQANDFAESCGLTMTTIYLGHYPRIDENHITANYRVTLTRPNLKPFAFDFSTSVNDSWGYRDRYKFSSKIFSGLPPRVDTDKFFASYLREPFTRYRDLEIIQRKNAPTLYDVLACLTKYDPGTFYDFCSEYGYSDDSIKAEKVWRAVTDEWREVERLFKDVMDALQKIN
jgi:hypothetical protein